MKFFIRFSYGFAAGVAAFMVLFTVAGCTVTAVADPVVLERGFEAPEPLSTLSPRALLQLLAAKQAAHRPVVVHFWATWCPPCVEELPRFLSAASRWSGRADILLLALDETEQRSEVERQVGAVAGRYLLDAPDPAAVTTAFSETWSGSLPATFVLDGGGNVLYRAAGPFDGALVEAALAK